MKTILVLGGFGFIGTNVLNYIDSLEYKDYNVIVFDKQTIHPFGLTFKCVSKVYTGDFCNKQDLSQIFEENDIGQVFHFLNTTVPATSEDIRFDVESNLLGTIGLLEIMEAYKVKNIVFLSSGGAIYNNFKSNSVHAESEDTFPLSSYGIVKLAIEKYIHMFGERSKLSYLILRLSNPYGPFHYSTKQGIINVAMRNTLKNEGVVIWGDGENRKDYIFINDFVEILMTLLQNGVSNEIINIGSGTTYSINEILEQIKVVEPAIDWSYIKEKEFDNKTFELSITKLREYIQNYKFTPLDIGIEKTLDWLKKTY